MYKNKNLKMMLNLSDVYEWRGRIRGVKDENVVYAGKEGIEPPTP